MNYIQYGSEFFHGNSSMWGTNGLIIEGNVEQRIALFGNELTADALTFVVNSRALQGDGTAYAFLLDSNSKVLKASDGKILIVRVTFTDWQNFVPGAPLDLYNVFGGSNIGRFYVQDVTRVSSKFVQFTCTDCVGILAGMDDHNGGIYTGETVENICDEIFAGSGLTYTVGDDVGAVQCFGRLPRDNRRTNLGRLLVAAGATLMEENGVVMIVYLGTGTASTIYQRNIYLGNGTVKNEDRATEVQVVEHAYYSLNTDESAVLYDNTVEVTPADGQLVIFDSPCHDLAVTGTLTIDESNANYAVVSGVGTLTGKKYTHTQRQVAKSTGVTSNKVKVEAINDNELIGYHNSDYVLQRMAKYYSVEVGVGVEALDPTGLLMPGTQVNLTDPFGTARTGWIKRKSFSLGNKTRAAMDIAIDWTPGPWGSNLDSYELITTSQTWTVPAGVTSVTFYIGGGGQAGYDGSNGTAGQPGANDQYSGTGEGGPGGSKGAGGSAGKVKAVTLTVTPGDTITISIGTGGTENGEAGTATTVTYNGTTYTSADGIVPENGFLNQFSGDVYALPGPDGVDGADGGSQNQNGGSVSEYSGGSKGATRSHTYSYGTGTGVGGGGGGAAEGNSGEDGESGDYYAGVWNQDRFVYGIGGDGGDGADAVTEPFDPGLSSGGRGGNGGGGGGGGGDGSAPQGTFGSNIHSRRGYGGSPGAGSPGTPGGNGFVLGLYRAAA